MKKRLPPLSPVGAGYLRLSDLPAKATSLERAKLIDDRQAELLAKAESMRIPLRYWYDDMNLSGYTLSLQDRPGMVQLLSDAKAGKFSHVFVRDWSRLARRVRDVEILFYELLDFGVSIITIVEPVIEDELTATLIRQGMSTSNQMHAMLTGIKTSQHRAKLASEGKFTGNQVPFGYSWNKEQQLFVPGERAEDVALLFRLYAETGGMGKTARALNARGILSPEGQTWSAQKVKTILRRPLYRGFVVYKGVESPARYEPIIPESILERVEEHLRSLREATHPQVNRDDIHPLAGRLRCSFCLRGIGIHLNIAKGKRYRYFSCKHARVGGCQLPLIREERVLEAVRDGILEQLNAQRESLRQELTTLTQTHKKSEAHAKRLEERQLAERRQLLERQQRQALKHLFALEVDSQEYRQTELVLGELRKELESLLELPTEKRTVLLLPKERIEEALLGWSHFLDMDRDIQKEMLVKFQVTARCDGITLVLTSDLEPLPRSILLPARKR